MLATVAFCMGVVVYVLGTGLDNESAQTAVNMSFVIIGTTVASYVFGATWETVNIEGKQDAGVAH